VGEKEARKPVFFINKEHSKIFLWEESRNIKTLNNEGLKYEGWRMKDEGWRMKDEGWTMSD